MNIFVTFDYELYFGSRTGTAQKCILEPTQKILEMAKPYQAHFTFFVDVLYLMKLKEYATIKSLDEEFKAIQHQLRALIKQGHDVQLHLHTHWINAEYTHGKWKLDYDKYRIHTFSSDEIDEIVSDSVSFLEELTQQKVFAVRAGGWCLQPFDKLQEAFQRHGIWLDSTVFYKGYNDAPTNLFDFRKSPDLDTWNFSEDPLQIEPEGNFTELPISSIPVSPSFYWKLALVKKMFTKKHQPAGDGKGIPNSNKQLMRILFTPTHSVVSCDGFKASLLEPAFKNHAIQGKDNFVIIGHPKMMSTYSLSKLDKFISGHLSEGHCFTSIQESFGFQNQNRHLFKRSIA